MGRQVDLVRQTLGDDAALICQNMPVDWVIADLIGKAGHVRTIPIPGWVKVAIDDWKEASGIKEGVLFRSINK